MNEGEMESGSPPTPRPAATAPRPAADEPGAWDRHSQPTGPLPAPYGPPPAPPPPGEPPPPAAQGPSREVRLLAAVLVLVLLAILLLGAWVVGGRWASPRPTANQPSPGAGPGPATATVGGSPPSAPPAWSPAPVATQPAGAGPPPSAPPPSSTPLPSSTPPPSAPPPVARISAPATARVGELITVSAAGGPFATVSWDFGDGAQAAGPVVTHAYDLAGQYVLRLSTSDAAGRSASAAQAILVQPAAAAPPDAVIAGPGQARLGQPVTFDGAASTPGGAAITAYQWQFGDGGSGAGQRVSHVFVQPGWFYVTLNVVAADGLSDAATQAIQVVAPEPPRAVIRAPGEAMVGQVVGFDGSLSSSGNPIVAYLWDFGDGAGTDAVVAQHAFASADDYTLRLTVIDQAGLRDTAEARIRVTAGDQPAPPEAAISGPGGARVGETVTYDASGSKPGGSPIRDYAWTISGPGTLQGAVGPRAAARFDLPGRYEVSVRVTDSAGLADQASLAVVVSGDLSSLVWTLDGVQPPVTLSAQAGRAAGSTGCNTYQLTYTALGDGTSGQLTVSPVQHTRRSCPGVDPQFEAAYFDTLQRVTHYAIDGDTLRLDGPGGTLKYRGRAPLPAPRPTVPR